MRRTYELAEKTAKASIIVDITKTPRRLLPDKETPRDHPAVDRLCELIRAFIEQEARGDHEDLRQPS